MGSDARTALVTGATGFIGGRLANALADDGWRVRAHDRQRFVGSGDVVPCRP